MYRYNLSWLTVVELSIWPYMAPTFTQLDNITLYGSHFYTAGLYAHIWLPLLHSWTIWPYILPLLHSWTIWSYMAHSFTQLDNMTIYHSHFYTAGQYGPISLPLSHSWTIWPYMAPTFTQLDNMILYRSHFYTAGQYDHIWLPLLHSWTIWPYIALTFTQLIWNNKAIAFWDSLYDHIYCCTHFSHGSITNN